MNFAESSSWNRCVYHIICHDHVAVRNSIDIDTNTPAVVYTWCRMMYIDTRMIRGVRVTLGVGLYCIRIHRIYVLHQHTYMLFIVSSRSRKPCPAHYNHTDIWDTKKPHVHHNHTDTGGGTGNIPVRHEHTAHRTIHKT